MLPFALGMFVLVEGMAVTGLIDLFAAGLAKTAQNPVAGLFSFSFISSVASNVLNNQPMSILFTRILANDNFKNAVSTEAMTESMFGLIMGSNFGANITIIGALAGIMWRSIVENKGFKVSALKFTMYGLMVMPQVIASASLVFYVERVAAGYV